MLSTLAVWVLGMCFYFESLADSKGFLCSVTFLCIHAFLSAALTADDKSGPDSQNQTCSHPDGVFFSRRSDHSSELRLAAHQQAVHVGPEPAAGGAGAAEEAAAPPAESEPRPHHVVRRPGRSSAPPAQRCLCRPQLCGLSPPHPGGSWSVQRTSDPDLQTPSSSSWRPAPF